GPAPCPPTATAPMPPRKKVDPSRGIAEMNDPLRRILPAFTFLALLAPSAHASADRPTYNRDIRPILAENCFACHGPDKAARKADLRLDIRDEAVKAGVIVPGKPSESSFIERVLTSDVKQLMPPKKTHKKLTAQQKQTLKRWVEQGAEYQPHWSF